MNQDLLHLRNQPLQEIITETLEKIGTFASEVEKYQPLKQYGDLKDEARLEYERLFDQLRPRDLKELGVMAKGIINFIKNAQNDSILIGGMLVSVMTEMMNAQVRTFSQLEGPSNMSELGVELNDSLMNIVDNISKSDSTRKLALNLLMSCSSSFKVLDFLYDKVLKAQGK